MSISNILVAAEAINRIESNPTVKKRVIHAVKEDGLAAFEKAIDNPAGAFVKLLLHEVKVTEIHLVED